MTAERKGMTDPIRWQALKMLNRLAAPQAPTLDHLVETLFERERDWQPRDRAFLIALVYGVLRWRGQLDWVLSHYSHTPLKKLHPVVHNILRLGLLQLCHLDRVPPAAAVNTSVELAKKQAPPYMVRFINGVLRSVGRDFANLKLPNPNSRQISELAAARSLPEWLVARWLERLGRDAGLALCAAQNHLPPLTLRTNTLKIQRDELARRLAEQGCHILLSDLAPAALTVEGWQGPVSGLAGFDKGLFQVQDAAAQLAGSLLAPQPGQRILDACAGLGGKTGLLAQLMGNQGQIVAVDSAASRLRQLPAEMQRLGISLVTVHSADLCQPRPLPAAEPFDRLFDGILLDAPCSGLGTLRRNPDLRWRRNPGDLPRYGCRQLQMMTLLAPLVRPGGTLVYAVCTTEPEETQEVIHNFLKQQPSFFIQSAVAYLPPGASHLADDAGCFKIEVHQHHTDGFFGARLARKWG